MTILDNNLRFDPSGTAITSTAASTNVIDLINARDLGVGDGPDGKINAMVTVGTAFTAAGAATLQVQAQASVDNSTWFTVSETDAIPKADLYAGAVIQLPIGPMPPQAAGIPRYYRLNYVVATGPMTAGTVTSDLKVGTAQQHPVSAAGYQSGYPSGFTVSN